MSLFRYIKELLQQKNRFVWLAVSLLFMSLHNLAYPQNRTFKFEHYNLEQGLPSAIVPCLIQDKTGYLWFGTYHGIARYDGYSIIKYDHYEGDSTSIINSIVEALCEDNNGIIWVGHAHGLDEFNPVTKTFKHHILNPDIPLTDWSQHVLSLHTDRDGILWVGTGMGLYWFNKGTNSFTWIKHSDKDQGSIISNSVNAIYEDRNGTLWFGTSGGLDTYDKTTKKFKHIWTEGSYGGKKALNEKISYWVISVCEDKNGIFWIGTNDGLVRYERQTNVFSIYRHDPKNSFSLSNNVIHSICEDQAGQLWISTQGGLDIFDRKSATFKHHTHNEQDPESISSNALGQVLKDRSGTIWISTYGSGIDKINITKPFLKRYSTDVITSGRLKSSYLSGITEDNTGIVWIGTEKGVVKFNPGNETFENQTINQIIVSLIVDNKGTLWVSNASGNIYYKKNQDNVFHKIMDSARIFFNQGGNPRLTNCKDGDIWIGTDNGTILKLNPISKKIKKIINIPFPVESLFEDSSGLLWIGTHEGGLFNYDQVKKTKVNFTHNDEDPMTISGNRVTQFCEDKKGTIWIVANRSLNKIERNVMKCIRLGGKDGFPQDVYDVIDDNSGNIWMGTPDGTLKYNPSTGEKKNYRNIIGWSYKMSNGELYINNKQGIIRFHPDSIRDNPFIPPIVITSFRKFEKPVLFGNVIRLAYDENFISFDFAALSFVDPEKNQYAYKLQGVDQDWVYSGTRRFASYPNLQPGKYIFRVKGSNNDGVWNEAGTSVALFIFPPWWKTWWAYSAYVLFLLFSLYWVRRYEMNRLSFKNQVKLDEVVLKEKEETDRMKSRFFANISHEFRTPLTLILGPAEKIISGTSDDNVKDANTIKRNSRRLLQLINQLLDLSKLEAGKLKLEVSKGNIVSFVKGVALSFESLAESKDITLRLQPEKEFIELYFDREKMMQVLTNIISNAFKFTPVDGKITVSVTENDQKHVKIKIRDNGIGIAKEEIPKLFDRFYQVDSSFTREYEGTGIGLALTKELVELHHGSIQVKSRKAVAGRSCSGWTEFSVELPLGRDYLKDEDIIKDVNKLIEPELPVHDESFFSHYKPDGQTETVPGLLSEEIQEEKTIILVVEDNYDMRQYIKESLDSFYLVEEAVNGEQGVRKAGKIIPDLIISDMMMPKMDGNELVRILKNEETTSHIPIILLTAKAGHEDKLEGLETGADDYLTKPFDIKELQVRVKNLIITRKKLQEKYGKPENLLPGIKDLKLNSIDEKFMFRVAQVIDKHIAEEEFDIEEFCSEVAMSRTQLHRKLKALTGKSASLYIRSVKLARAKKMIEEQQGIISEIAYSVGFSSPAYFTRCFKEEFGYTPSELKK